MTGHFVVNIPVDDPFPEEIICIRDGVMKVYKTSKKEKLEFKESPHVILNV